LSARAYVRLILTVAVETFVYSTFLIDITQALGLIA